MPGILISSSRSKHFWGSTLTTFSLPPSSTLILGKTESASNYRQIRPLQQCTCNPGDGQSLDACARVRQSPASIGLPVAINSGGGDWITQGGFLVFRRAVPHELVQVLLTKNQKSKQPIRACRLLADLSGVWRICLLIQGQFSRVFQANQQIRR